jgi:hypothetical protein
MEMMRPAVAALQREVIKSSRRTERWSERSALDRTSKLNRAAVELRRGGDEQNYFL